MSENYLMLNGKRIDLTDEQVKTLTYAGRQYLFKRGNRQEFFAIDVNGDVSIFTDDFSEYADEIFTAANYCTDKAMMEQRALHETLNRLLWRYSEEHGGDNEWNGDNPHWSIVRNREIIGSVSVSVAKENGVIYFKNKETAQSAIDEIVKPFMEQHPEFVW